MPHSRWYGHTKVLHALTLPRRGIEPTVFGFFLNSDVLITEPYPPSVSVNESDGGRSSVQERRISNPKIRGVSVAE